MSSMHSPLSLTALFDTPGRHRSTRRTRPSKAGYTRFDVHTPYPVHGMDRAMRLKSVAAGLLRPRLRAAGRDLRGRTDDLDHAGRLSARHRRQAVLVLAGVRAGGLRDHGPAGLRPVGGRDDRPLLQVPEHQPSAARYAVHEARVVGRIRHLHTGRRTRCFDEKRGTALPRDRSGERRSPRCTSIPEDL